MAQRNLSINQHLICCTSVADEHSISLIELRAHQPLDTGNSSVVYLKHKEVYYDETSNQMFSLDSKAHIQHLLARCEHHLYTLDSALEFLKNASPRFQYQRKIFC